MNERITELYIQARQLAQETADKNKYDTYAEYQQSVSDKSYDRFAELIVQECAKVILENPVKYIEIDALHRIRDSVKEHFGVTK